MTGDPQVHMVNWRFACFPLIYEHLGSGFHDFDDPTVRVHARDATVGREELVIKSVGSCIFSLNGGRSEQ